MTVHVNIGSNLGDSRALVGQAARAIARRLGVDVREATAEESEPWGFESSHRFVNLGIAFESDLAPADLLRALQEVERGISDASHRNADGSYADRLIDIDLIAVGDMTLETDSLVIPHPRMHLRPFVLRPVAELDPGWIHPRLGLTSSELLARLK